MASSAMAALHAYGVLVLAVNLGGARRGAARARGAARPSWSAITARSAAGAKTLALKLSG
eukprot:scaffold13253_cov140-Isochrysis_galbana.AAC.9